MKAADKRKLEDLERRVRELEARPVVYPAIVILQPPAPAPVVAPWPWMHDRPFYLGDPVWQVSPYGAPGTFTC